jgi:hypothetical protein
MAQTELETRIERTRASRARTLCILVLYDDRALQTCYVREHLESLRRHSRHAVYYAAANAGRDLRFSLDPFDAVLIHFSIRLAYDWHFSPTFAEALVRFRGAKVAMIQDEYDLPQVACRWIRRLHLQCVFTTTSDKDRESFYPRDEVGDIEFRRVLTGYVPACLETARPPSLAERPIHVGYRGRVLPYWYGLLAREKHEIGARTRAICVARGIPHDIEWSEEQRFQGTAWWDFIARCRTMLATESGSNVVDWDGSIRARVQSRLAAEPDLPFEEVFATIIAAHEGRVSMNQIPPKAFEAIALRTGLVLFEGAYSGVLRPDVHYIPLRRDFANVDTVLARVEDTEAMHAMIERAHRDIVRSGAYSYSRLVESVDDVFERYSRPADHPSPGFARILVREDESPSARTPPGLPLTRPLPGLDEESLVSGGALKLWLSLPAPFRAAIRPYARPVAAALVARRNPSAH